MHQQHVYVLCIKCVLNIIHGTNTAKNWKRRMNKGVSNKTALFLARTIPVYERLQIQTDGHK